MTSTEAAAVIGCSPRHVRHLISTGSLRATRRESPGGGFHYSLLDSSVFKYANMSQTTGYPRGQARPKGKKKR